MRDLGSLGRGVAAGAGAWVRQTMGAGLGLLALALATGSLGDLSRTLNGVLAVGGLLALALLTPRRKGHLSAWLIAAALAIMAVSLLLVARGEPLGLLGAALFLFALSSLTSEEGAGRLDAMFLTALLFALYRTLVAYVPALWHLEQSAAIYFSWFVGVGLMLGPTALGLPLFALFAFHAISVFLLALGSDSPSTDSAVMGCNRPRWRAFLVLLAWLAALVLAAVAFIWLQPPLGSWLLTNWPTPIGPSPAAASLPALTYQESLPLLFLLLWIVTALGSLLLRPVALPQATPAGSRRWLAAGLGLLALGTMVLTLEPPTRPRRGTILFHDAGHLDWGRPVFGQYGPHSGGTFGLWPDYLAAYGYGAQIGPLTAENLAEARAVVLINLPENLSTEEKERLLAFVEAGGGLIIWGEHTGLGRVREPVNDLLAHLPGTPIRLRFDSAVPARQGWAEGLTLVPHPALYDVQDAVDLVIAVGASLDIGPAAQPLIVGRFGHSDRGDATNRARNYVGDMRYNPGERLGDVVLGAEIQHGQGRIVVLGDTTPLGSVNLMTAMPFHAQLLDWVTAEPSGVWGLFLRNGWLAALLLLGAGICLALGRSRQALGGAALVMALALALTGFLNVAQTVPGIPTGPIVYVDISHQERFDRLLWEETSIGGLSYNLVRNGGVPLLLREIEGEILAGAELLVLIAPGQPFSTQEVETISDWVSEGGRLLVSVGFEESGASEDLLAAFDLAVGHIPLGPVEVEREPGQVQFHEAWPVHATSEDALTIIEGYGYPLATYQPWGEGGVVLIGDSSFLLGGSLEGQNFYREGNILLLRDILQEYLGLGGSP